MQSGQMSADVVQQCVIPLGQQACCETSASYGMAKITTCSIHRENAIVQHGGQLTALGGDGHPCLFVCHFMNVLQFVYGGCKWRE